MINKLSLKQLILLLLLVVITASCKSKKTYSSKKQTRTVNVKSVAKSSKAAQQIVKTAKTYNGTPYKYGGNTKRGIDCSGLIHNSFKAHQINVPRTTAELKTTGTWIDLKKVNIGDLVFFATNKKNRKINHVGIVTNARLGNIEFIHASSSKGVMVSSLAERYWYFAFVQARRML